MTISQYLTGTAKLLTETAEAGLGQPVASAIDVLVEAIDERKSVLVCGNGGSAADAMHIAGELVGRYMLDRPAYKVISLGSDAAITTAWSNDFEYETLFARQVEALGEKGGVLGQHYSHELDLAWFWMGCPKPEWAFGVKHSVHPLYDGPEGPAEDYYSGLVGLEGGKTIQIDCTRWLHCDTSPTVIELYGSEGDITQGKISRSNDDKEYVLEDADEPLDVPHSEQTEKMPVFYYEIEHFALAVAGEVEPDVNAADSYIFMKILDALYDSARDGQKIVID